MGIPRKTVETLVLAFALGLLPQALLPTKAQELMTGLNPMRSSKPSKGISAHALTVETGSEVVKENQGFLACATAVVKSQFHHGNTNEASGNLVSTPNKTSTAVIVGHGARGIQCTGDGDHCSDDPKMVAFFNVPTWEPLATKLRGQFRALTLLGCNIGTGSDGSTLLKAVAQAAQMPVMAPDRMVFCGPDGITLIDGSPITWAIATPNGAVTQMQEQPYNAPKSEFAQFKIAGQYKSVAMNAVSVLEFKYRGYRRSEFQTFRNADLSTLTNFIDFNRPVETKGRPGAIVTGRLRLGIKIGTANIERTFVLYNDELLEDMTEQDVFYRAADGLAEYMNRFAR